MLANTRLERNTSANSVCSVDSAYTPGGFVPYTHDAGSPHKLGLAAVVDYRATEKPGQNANAVDYRIDAASQPAMPLYSRAQGSERVPADYRTNNSGSGGVSGAHAAGGTAVGVNYVRTR
jgi:hypothetical protein